MSTSRVQITTAKGHESRLRRDAAYFLSLRLRNVRCFGNAYAELRLSSQDGIPTQWTILLGDNGVGKTTVLQSLAAFEPVLPVGIREDEVTWKSPRIFKLMLDGLLPSFAREGDPQPSQISASIGLFAKAPDNSQQNFDYNNGNKIDYTLNLKYEPNSMTYPAIEVDALICYGYGAARRLGRASALSGKSGDATESLYRSDIELIDAEEWLLRLDYSASKKSSIQGVQRKQRDQAIELLLKIFPRDGDQDLITDIRFSEPSRARPHPTVEFKTPYGWVPLRQLSHGYQTMIAWVVDLASRMVDRYPDSPDPLSEPAVVLVDEIDLHLHPTWQRKLIGYLTERFPNTQFIATAHSPLIVQAASDANIALLKRVGDHVEIINDVEDIKNWRVDQILTSDLFGLESARPPHVAQLLKRQNELLERPKLSKKAKEELAEIEKALDGLPTGETAEQVNLMRRIDATLQRLKERQDRDG